MRFHSVFSLLILAAGCGGALQSPDATEPPPADTRFNMRIDGKAVALQSPTGTKYVIRSKEVTATYVSISATEKAQGDNIRGASVTLNEPLKTGSFDCTPDANGALTGGATLVPGPFFGFSTTLTDCKVEVIYVADDRAVGNFSASAHAPAQSSLAGKVAKVEGEFDVPLVVQNLP